MKTLLFIGLEFHKRTQSADFLVDLLKKEYAITFCYVDEYSEDPYSAFNAISQRKFEVLLCWQVMPPRELIDRHFQFNHAAFLPMYDGCPNVHKVDKWWLYRDFNFICFSQEVERNLSGLGYSAKYIQYFPEPAEKLIFGDEDSAFLWFRRERIGPKLVEKLFSKYGLKNLHVHNVPDPGNEKIARDADQGSLCCSFSTWYDDRRDMQKDIESRAYYIAPREKEGIGMSFLEAMAMGKCVVSPDYSTMNEYIEHGRTGLLYNLKKVKPFEPVDVRRIQENTYSYMCEGYQKWLQKRGSISSWLVDPLNTSSFKLVVALFFRFFRNPSKVCCALWAGRSGRRRQ